jgi:plasmid maintenance system antidote protein VapI
MTTKALNPTWELRRFCDTFRTRADAAKALGISAPYLSDLCNGRRDVTDELLEKLGLRRIVVKETT